MKIFLKKIFMDWFVKILGDMKFIVNLVIDIDNWGFGCLLNSMVL